MPNISDLSFNSAGSHARAVVFEEHGDRVQIVKVPSGATVKPHYHRKRTEIFILLQGEGTISINDKIAARKVHDVAVCRPGDTHEVNNLGDKDMLIGVCAFDYDQNDSHETEGN